MGITNRWGSRRRGGGGGGGVPFAHAGEREERNPYFPLLPTFLPHLHHNKRERERERERIKLIGTPPSPPVASNPFLDTKRKEGGGGLIYRRGGGFN